ncbi:MULTISPECIES: aminotransferase class I/II-fold pyridoxal phosphate-dependent enzyme [Fusobacterium]|uniref:aminotransferase class I/II-fold pyridoxal phosphate-dependent enzyme n=1 Tax=Fusobacterium TaxID=848 RepID=UPI0014772C0E|nr:MULTISPECIES: aminotransferase class I/II-fold pyridoxal phosphate-dependent enzyme [Fusobacterium]NME35615.1 aminotransferase class I/II-fold pyridoxal phosphate-dependent enzyme [Fusobacterium sp. FSA-380-WT-3A]
MEINKIEERLRKNKEEKNFRSLKIIDENRLNLSSNDYLGIGQDKNLKDKFLEEYRNEISFSSSSSRLITGNYKIIRELEEELNKIYGKKSLVMNSGFSANKTIIETFYNKDSLIITDRLNHASIYDGILASGSKIIRYKHLDVNHLENILEKYHRDYSDILVVTETVYSMDGDIAPIKEIVNLKKKYKFDLMVDEAHSYGVFGYGISYEEDLIKDIDFITIPLGKGGGSIGAYIICSDIHRDYLINFGREFIYTTALPPVNNLWNLFILKNMKNFQEKREKLEDLKNFTLNKIKQMKLKTTSTSHIISLIIGDNEKADIVCKNLREKGYIVYPIKSPTVLKGSERMRLGLNPNISKVEIEKFLEEFKNECNNLF